MIRKKINIGLIGCGVVCMKRISNLPKNFNLIACADPLIFLKKNIVLKNKKIFLTKNWKTLLKLENLDAVIIATTHKLHTDILLEWLKYKSSKTYGEYFGDIVNGIPNGVGIFNY